LWGCIGLHFSGEWKDAGSAAYQGRVLQHLDNKDWREFSHAR